MKKIIAIEIICLLLLTILASLSAAELKTSKILDLKKIEFDKKIDNVPNLPDYLKPGDIVVFFYHNIDLAEHSVMYIGARNGSDCFIESSLPGKYSTIDGVKITDMKTMWNKHYEHRWIYASVVTATEAQKEEAIKWCESKLGEKFQRIPLPGIKRPFDNWAKTTERYDPHYFPFYKLIKNNYNKWYCSELIWAAYYFISDGKIDLDCNGWSRITFGIPAVVPWEILVDNDVIQYNKL